MRWAIRSIDDVPEGDEWLSGPERALAVGLKGRRRAEWRLGRWTAKALLGPEAEILPGLGGAPRTPGAAVSISHRKGRALAVAAAPEVTLGCDLEPLRPHGPAFLRAVLTDAERERVEALRGDARLLVATIAWTAKEAAYKALGGGREIRESYVGFTGPHDASIAPLLTDGVWRPLLVDWPDGAAIGGWWRAEDGWVMAVASEPAEPAPTA